jgi:hypothetical protein
MGELSAWLIVVSGDVGDSVVLLSSSFSLPGRSLVPPVMGEITELVYVRWPDMSVGDEVSGSLLTVRRPESERLMRSFCRRRRLYRIQAITPMQIHPRPTKIPIIAETQAGM